jgi:hypothetical protein
VALQSLNPFEQLRVQTLELHEGVLLGSAAHTLPQPLQLLTSLVMLISQPSP